MRRQHAILRALDIFEEEASLRGIGFSGRMDPDEYIKGVWAAERRAAQADGCDGIPHETEARTTIIHSRGTDGLRHSVRQVSGKVKNRLNWKIM
ncbi:MAG: hypothetical protein ACLUI3_14760 [Christensenellales bacterium]